MSNEELAVRIKAGERELLPELWGQVERLIRQRAAHRAEALNGFGGVTAEDLCQSGFFALLEAVAAFDPSTGYKFTTYLDRPLRTAFAVAAGYRTQRQKRDPMQSYVALDAPAGEDEDGETLGDFQADPAAEDAFLLLEDTERWETLRKAMESLPEEQRRAIYERYWLELPLTPERRKQEAWALRVLRHPRNSRALKEFL